MRLSKIKNKYCIYKKRCSKRSIVSRTTIVRTKSSWILLNRKFNIEIFISIKETKTKKDTVIYRYSF